MLGSFIQKALFPFAIGIGLALVFLIWLLSYRERSKSRFKVREADRDQDSDSEDQIAHHNKKIHENPKRLKGIRIDGAPHEILDIDANAGRKQILAAYRRLMKIYHPDKVGRPGSREWNDAQKIATAINVAKGELLKKRKKRQS